MAFCTQCGTKIVASWNVCPNCGHKLNSKHIYQQPIQAQAPVQTVSQIQSQYQLSIIIVLEIITQMD